MKRFIPKITGSLLMLMICLGFVPGQIDPKNNKQAPVIVTYTSIVYGNVTRLQPIIDAFNQANPGISVQFLPYPAGPMGTVQSTDGFKQFAATNADTTLNEFNIEESDKFLDLQSLIDSDPTIQTDDFWPGEWGGCQDEKGRTVGVPVNLHFHGVFYDQAAFNEAKISTPKPGWTWDDFRQTANSLSRKTGNSSRFGFGALDPTYPEILLPLVAAGINKADGKLDVDKLSRDLQWYVDMVKDDKFYPTKDLLKSSKPDEGVDNPWARLFLENKQPAMWVGYIRNPEPDLALRAQIAHSMSQEYDPMTHLAISKFGMAPFPIEADGSNVHTTPIFTDCALISANSAHPREALMWLNFLSRQWFMFDQSKPLSELTNIPARPSVAEKVGFWHTLPAAVEPTVRYGLDHGLYQIPNYKTMKEVYTALDKAISGKSSLLKALQEANTKINGN